MCAIFCRYNVIITNISKDFKQNVIKLFKNVKFEQHKYALFQTKEKRLYFSALFLRCTGQVLFLITVTSQHNTDYVVYRKIKVILWVIQKHLLK